jgi:hypothetical protein
MIIKTKEIMEIISKMNDGIYYKKLFNKSLEVKNYSMHFMNLAQVLTIILMLIFHSATKILLGICLGIFVAITISMIINLIFFYPFWREEMNKRYRDVK